MGDIHYWKDSISADIEAAQSIIDSIPNIDDDLERTAALDSADKKLRSAKGNTRTFKMEIRLLSDPEERGKYERELSHYEQTVSKMTADVKTMRNERSRDQLFVGAQMDNGTEPDPFADGDALLNDASRLQDKTQTSLAQTQKMIEDTKIVGLTTVEELGRQREQISNIDEDVMRMEDSLNRADKLIKTFGKRMATDKLIQCFTLLNVLLVVGVVIYAIVKNGKLTGDDKDSGAPENPVGAAANRMLRGIVEGLP